MLLLFAHLQEDYCDQSTLESRLQDVARRLVERQPGANGAAGPSMHMGAVPQASGLPGSGLSSGSSAGPSQYGPSFGANPGMMPQGLGAAHPPDIVHELPAQPMRPGMPPGVSAPIPPAGPSGADAAGGSGNGFQPGGLVPGFVPSQNPLSSTMMSNGAPVLLRGSAARSEWSAPPNVSARGVVCRYRSRPFRSVPHCPSLPPQVSNPSAVLNMSMNGNDWFRCLCCVWHAPLSSRQWAWA